MAGLWAEVANVWQTAVFGIGVGQVLLALATFLLFLLFLAIWPDRGPAGKGGRGIGNLPPLERV